MEDPELSCFDNYIQLWEDPVFWSSLKNNLIWPALSLSPIVGLALALFFHVKSPVASIYKSLFLCTDGIFSCSGGNDLGMVHAASVWTA